MNPAIATFSAADNFVITWDDGRSSTTVTVASTAHGLTTGQIVGITFAAGTGGTATDNIYVVTVSDANTFTVTDSASGSITGSPAVTMYADILMEAGATPRMVMISKPCGGKSKPSCMQIKNITPNHMVSI